MNLNQKALRYMNNVHKAFEYARDERERCSQLYKESGDPAAAEERERMHDVLNALSTIIADSEG